VLATADILVLAHGAKGAQPMQANCDSFLALIDRCKRLTRHRQVPVEVWAVGPEIECHPALGNPELQSYARSKRTYARAAARLMHDGDVLYRHIVPSAFRSRMGGGLMSGRTAAAIAFWLIRRGFRYVPVTFTGIAFLNFVPFFLRGAHLSCHSWIIAVRSYFTEKLAKNEPTLIVHSARTSSGMRRPSLRMGHRLESRLP